MFVDLKTGKSNQSDVPSRVGALYGHVLCGCHGDRHNKECLNGRATSYRDYRNSCMDGMSEMMVILSDYVLFSQLISSRLIFNFDVEQ